MGKWDKRFLEMAKLVSTWSKDPSRCIGAVAVDDDRRVLSMGYNGFPGKLKDTEERLRDKETKYSMIIHAEMNVIYNATASGVSLKDSTLYVYGLPACSDCTKGIIQVGVKRLVVSYPRQCPENWLESWKKSIKMLDEAGVEIHSIHTETIEY